jgi:thiaminase/transcriptional activator TenA
VAVAQYPTRQWTCGIDHIPIVLAQQGAVDDDRLDPAGLGNEPVGTAGEVVDPLQFARANALAAYKSRTLADITAAHRATGAILAETELHLRLTDRWGIPRAELEAAAEKQATVAYTRYVLDSGMAGDLLDLHVALAPCTIGYAEIGAHLAPRLAEHDGEHPYGEWISEYSGAEFTAAAGAAIEQLDVLSEGGLTDRRLDELTEVFRTATRLEIDFWQQALDSTG